MAAVNTAIGGRTDLSFDAATGTLTYSGDGNPMANLVISLDTVDDRLVEGTEDFKVVLSDPGTTTVSDITLGASEAPTTILDNDRRPGRSAALATVTEGNTASYTVIVRHAAVGRGRLDRVSLANEDHERDGSDLATEAQFDAAVEAAVTAKWWLRPGRAEL